MSKANYVKPATVAYHFDSEELLGVLPESMSVTVDSEENIPIDNTSHGNDNGWNGDLEIE